MIKLTFFVALFGYTVASHWSYKDQKSWPGQCNDPNFAMYQSPVDIPSLCSGPDANKTTFRIPADKKHMGNLELTNYEKNLGAQPWKLENNGHSAQLSLLDGSKEVKWAPYPLAKFAPMQDTRLQLAQLHFHWHATDDNAGTEHAIDGRRRAIELHLVHYDIDYPQVTTPRMVMAVQFEVSEHDNPALKPIVDRLSEIEEVNKNTWLPDGIILDKLLPKNREQFYNYFGSLTTPNCDMGVQWIVFSEIQKIGRAQLAAFRKLRGADGEPLSVVRDLQPHGFGRTFTVPHAGDGCESANKNDQRPTTPKPSWWRKQFNKAKGFVKTKLH